MNRLIGVVMSTILVGGCSFGLPKAARVRSEPALPCKTSSARPGVDTVVAVLGVLVAVSGGVTIATASPGSDYGPSFGWMVAVPGAVMVTGGVLGTIHGERSLTACQEREGAQGGTRTRTVLTTGT